MLKSTSRDSLHTLNAVHRPGHSLHHQRRAQTQLKSDQIRFYIAQSHNHIASVGLAICTVDNIPS